MQASSTFTITKWAEHSYVEQPVGARISRVNGHKTFSGDMDGISQIELIIYYWPDGAGTFLGFEHFIGRVGDRVGSFTLQHTGTYVDGSIISTMVIVAGSGVDDLADICGMGQSILAEHQAESPFTLHYNFMQQDVAIHNPLTHRATA